jgi:hypothetical protein
MNLSGYLDHEEDCTCLECHDRFLSSSGQTTPTPQLTIDLREVANVLRGLMSTDADDYFDRAIEIIRHIDREL